MEKIRYRKFENPTQVMFWDTDGNHWCGGIGYGTEIICGCCGGVVDIDEVYEFAPEEIINPLMPFEHWVDISIEIIGFDRGSEEALEVLDETD